jgi:hypothetical protein
MAGGFGGGQTGATGISDVLRGQPGFTFEPTAAATPAGGDDQLKRLAAQLQIANGVAGLSGMLQGATRGPGPSPLMPRMGGGAIPFTPTAGLFGRRQRRLSDLL